MERSNGLLDFHTHILPGVDDGSRDADQSLQLLREEARQGVGTVALTPHFYAERDYPQRFLDRRARALETLLAAGGAAEDAVLLPRLLLGAEVHYYEGISYSEEIRTLALEGTRLLLLEPPHAPWRHRMLEEIGSIPDRLGLTPVIAHLDRYLPLQRDAALIGALMRREVLVQVNAEGLDNRKTARWVRQALSRGELHFFGSDCHNLTDRAPNLFGAARCLAQNGLTPAWDNLMAQGEALTATALLYGFIV